MNYNNYLTGSFQMSSNNGQHVTAYLEDRRGDIKTMDFVLPNNNYYYNYTKEELDYYICNYINRNGDNLSTLDLIGYSIGANEDMYFVCTNKVDFLMFSCNHDSYGVYAVRFNDIDGENYDDYTIPQNYSVLTSYGVFNTGTNKDSFQKALSNNQFTFFDYTSLIYDNGDYKQDVNVIRGENVAIYNTYFHINGASSDNVVIGYGSPFNDLYQQGFQTGYGNGSASGYVTGYDNGYSAGVSSGGNAVTGREATAFSYITQAFGVASSIMSLEVLPHVTLGLCFTIPLVFVLIMTIFKLVRK